MIHYHLTTTAPLALVRAYRHIPCRVRRIWSFGSSSSHKAEAAILGGAGWSAVFRYGIPRFRGVERVNWDN